MKRARGPADEHVELAPPVELPDGCSCADDAAGGAASSRDDGYDTYDSHGASSGYEYIDDSDSGSGSDVTCGCCRNSDDDSCACDSEFEFNFTRVSDDSDADSENALLQPEDPYTGRGDIYGRLETPTTKRAALTAPMWSFVIQFMRAPKMLALLSLCNTQLRASVLALPDWHSMLLAGGYVLSRNPIPIVRGLRVCSTAACEICGIGTKRSGKRRVMLPFGVFAHSACLDTQLVRMDTLTPDT